ELRKPLAALDDFKQAIRLGPYAEDHFGLGRILYRQENYQEAVKAYNAALSLPAGYTPVRPGFDYAEVYRRLGEAFLGLPEYEKAERSFSQYLARAGRPIASVYVRRGLTRAQLGNYQGAIEDYTQALTLKPDSATHTYRGWVYLVREASKPALDDFEK